MKTSIKCEVCGEVYEYPFNLDKHRHIEQEIGGVPINYWNAKYILEKQSKLDVGLDKGIYKYKNYLPDYDENFTLEEGNTALIPINCDINGTVYLKDESSNPTGSFKDRGMPLLMSEIKAYKKNTVAIPSTGNAAISLTKYAKQANINSIVFVPETITEEKKELLKDATSIMYDEDLVESFEHCFSYCRDNENVFNGFLSTNISYLMGIKTIAYEIYEQLNNSAPDWIIIPCASGGSFVAQYIGFSDLYRMGLIKKIPRFVSVQIAGGDPITVGYESKMTKEIVLLDNPVDSETVLSSDTCFNYFKILDILELTNGIAVSITDEEIKKLKNKKQYPQLEISSMGGYVAMQKIKDMINEDDKVVIVGTAGEKKKI
ncbi:MAG: hypothetical protein A2Y24_08785 [Clostridiales bacterium GWE2_32_10]|nr:MAG: hypothetical protein A2Y24_08785 [Clostridiales bacterium GWE2_32_10]